MVSNFDAQFIEQQTDFLKEEDKKTKNKQMKKQSRFTNTKITMNNSQK